MNERRSSKRSDARRDTSAPGPSPDLARLLAAKRRGTPTADSASAIAESPIPAMPDRDDIGRALIASGSPFGRGASAPWRRLCHPHFVDAKGAVVTGRNEAILALVG